MAATPESMLIAERLFGVKLPKNYEEQAESVSVEDLERQVYGANIGLPDLGVSDGEVTPGTLSRRDAMENAGIDPRTGQSKQLPQNAPIVQQVPPAPNIIRQGRGYVANPRAVEQAAAQEGTGISQAYDEQAAAQTRLGEAQRKENAAVAQGRDELGAFNQETAKQVEAMNAAYALDAEKRLDEIRALANQAASFKIKPDRIWTDGGNFQKTAGLVSAFIGGFLAPVLGSNDIQGIIERGIDRDIAAQRDEKASLERQVDRAIQFDSIAKQNAGDEEEAYLQQRLFRLTSLQSQIDAQVLRAHDPVIKENAALVASQIKITKETTMAELENRVRTRFENQAKQQTQLLENQRQRGFQASQQAKMIAHQKAMQEDAQAHDLTKIETAGEFAIKKAEAEAAGKAAEGVIPSSTGFKSRSGKVVNIPDDTERRQIKKSARELRTQIRTASALKQIALGNVRDPFDTEDQLAKALATSLGIEGMSLGSGVSDKDVQYKFDQSGGDPSKFFSALTRKQKVAVLNQYIAIKKNTGSSLAEDISDDVYFDPDVSNEELNATVNALAGNREQAQVSSRQILGKILTTADRLPDSKLDSSQRKRIIQTLVPETKQFTELINSGTASAEDGRNLYKTLIDKGIQPDEPFMQDLAAGIKAGKLLETQEQRNEEAKLNLPLPGGKGTLGDIIDENPLFKGVADAPRAYNKAFQKKTEEIKNLQFLAEVNPEELTPDQVKDVREALIKGLVIPENRIEAFEFWVNEANKTGDKALKAKMFELNKLFGGFDLSIGQ